MIGSLGKVGVHVPGGTLRFSAAGWAIVEQAVLAIFPRPENSADVWLRETKNQAPGNSLCPFRDGEFTWPLQKGCWWPPTIGDKKVTNWITWIAYIPTIPYIEFNHLVYYINLQPPTRKSSTIWVLVFFGSSWKKSLLSIDTMCYWGFSDSRVRDFTWGATSNSETSKSQG